MERNFSLFLGSVDLLGYYDKKKTFVFFVLGRKSANEKAFKRIMGCIRRP